MRLLGTILCVALLLGTSPAFGGGSERILLIGSGNVPSSIRQVIASVARKQGTLANQSVYSRRARARGLAPTSPDAIRSVARRSNVDVAMTATFRAEGRREYTLTLQYYDGTTGERLARRVHKLRFIRLERATQRRIGAEIRAALDTAAGRTQRAEEQHAADVVASAGGLPEPEFHESGAAPRRARRAERDRDPAPADALPEPALEPIEEEQEPAEGVEGAEATDDPEEPAEWRPVTYSLALGPGMATRTLSVPSEAGRVSLDTSFYPTLFAAVAINIQTKEESSFSFGVRTRYASSIALRLQDRAVDGTVRTVDARTQYFAGGLYMRFRLSDKPRSSLFTIDAGYGLRTLNADGRLSVPAYTLSGPFARLALRFPLGSGPLWLTLAPEAASMRTGSERMQDMNGASSGYLIGGEVRADLELVEWLGLTFMYREAHAFLSSDLDGKVKDAERLILLKVAYIF